MISGAPSTNEVHRYKAGRQQLALQIPNRLVKVKYGYI